jgi:HAD superfamily hydrolase (TIGR01509 family)
MNLLARQHWIFDLDGTLTVAVHDFEAIRAELGLPPGRPILEELDALPDAVAAPKRARLDALELDLARASTPQPGAVAFVLGLRARGARLGVLTRNSRLNAEVTLAAIGLRDAFETEDLIGRDEAPPKPHPGGIARLLERWGAAPHEAVVAGDFRFDLEAGRAAGTATLHFDPDGRFPFAALADRCCAGWAELL